jgi:hypothetical protein
LVDLDVGNSDPALFGFLMMGFILVFPFAKLDRLIASIQLNA